MIVLGFGDHQPVIAREFADPTKVSHTPFTTFYRVNSINFDPDFSKLQDSLDIPFLATALLEASRLPMSNLSNAAPSSCKCATAGIQIASIRKDTRISPLAHPRGPSFAVADGFHRVRPAAPATELSGLVDPGSAQCLIAWPHARVRALRQCHTDRKWPMTTCPPETAVGRFEGIADSGRSSAPAHL